MRRLTRLVRIPVISMCRRLRRHGLLRLLMYRLRLLRLLSSSSIGVRHISSGRGLASREHDGLAIGRTVLAHVAAHRRSHGEGLHARVDDDGSFPVADVGLVAAKDEQKKMDGPM